MREKLALPKSSDKKGKDSKKSKLVMIHIDEMQAADKEKTEQTCSIQKMTGTPNSSHISPVYGR
jgi:hypothetical protein